MDFVINYDAIQEICENKNRPELNCHGTCYLKKGLAESAESDNSYANNKKQQTQVIEILFISEIDWTLNSPALAIDQEVNDRYQSHYKFLVSSDSFKPPLV
nr:hypothetical protein [uncultured Flavobacterium sp.]